jgi:hypothetical protein
MAETFEDVAHAKYLLLTTYTKDGRPKPTPVHAWWWIPQALVRGGIDKVHSAIEITPTGAR